MYHYRINLFLGSTKLKKQNMKTIKLTLFALAAIMLNSCGGDAVEEPAEKTFNKISSSEFKVSNMDKKYFKLTEGAEIELVINNDGGLEVSCEFEVVETFTEQAKYNQVFVSIVAKDEKNKTIEFSTITSGEMRTDDSDGSQFLDFMMGEPGSKSTFTFTGSVFDMETFSINKEATLQSVEKIKSFKVLTDR